MSQALMLVALMTATLVSQTTNVAGTNQLTINWNGEGGTSCINVFGSAAAGTSLASNAQPNTPFITALAGACAVGVVPVPGG
jgi:hypothetical protein